METSNNPKSSTYQWLIAFLIVALVAMLCLTIALKGGNFDLAVELFGIKLDAIVQVNNQLASP